MHSAPSTTSPAPTASFAERLLALYNAGALTTMISVGFRTGLFETLARMAPGSSEAIAERAGLHERYVREWLGAMVAGGICEYDERTHTYALPRAHAASLVQDAGPDNLAPLSQYVPLLGTVEDRIVECFRRGGGVPYEAYHRFHEVMASDSAQSVLPVLLDRILPLAPGLVARLEGGIDVLDVGCGQGRALRLMAQAFPRSRFAGIDLLEAPIATARREAAVSGLSSVRFDVLDASTLDRPGRYDLVTAFDAIHDQAHPDRVLRAIHAALRPRGVFLMQDIGLSSHVGDNRDHPLAPLLYTISCMHCMTVSLAQGGAGLGAAWGREKALEMLGDAGFGAVEVHDLPHDAQNCYYVARRG